ncbi:MAG: hypothetical protein AAB522_01245, partial [Patescibacteria group bacterium]
MSRRLKALPNRSENELYAISLAHELIDKFEVFDNCILSLELDEAGIDMLLIKKLKNCKIFRFHLQHKSSDKAADFFRMCNPCIPVWIVNKKVKSHEA